MHSRLFLDYKEGTIYLDWVVSTAYTKNTFVKYTNKSIYYCIQSHTSSSIITPLDTEYWYKTQDSFIGVTERMKYNSQKSGYLSNSSTRNVANAPNSGIIILL